MGSRCTYVKHECWLTGLHFVLAVAFANRIDTHQRGGRGKERGTSC